MTFEDWNEPTEEKQWKVGALIQCTEITYKAALSSYIDALKEAMFDETGDSAFCDYCPGCESGECLGHTYDKRCACEDEKPHYEGNYPPDY